MNVSIVVPAFNAAGTVAQTLDALLAQSVPAAEIVVVDDGSKDQTRQVLDAYRDRVRLVFQPNSGPSAARNLGVAAAQGEWIAFCDADDLWHPEKLRVMSAVLAQDADTGLVFHDFWTIVDGRVAEVRATHSLQMGFPLFQEFDVSIPRILTRHRAVESDVPEFGVVDTWHGSAFRWLMLGNFLLPSTVMIRRTAFDEAGGFDASFRHAEDTEFFLRFGKSHAMTWVDCPLTGYRRAAGSLLATSMYETTRNGARAVERHCVEDAEVYEGPDSAWVRRAVARRFTRLAYFCFSELNTAEARAHARSALRHRPADARAWSVWLASLVPRRVLSVARQVREMTRG